MNLRKVLTTSVTSTIAVKASLVQSKFPCTKVKAMYGTGKEQNKDINIQFLHIEIG